jgi:hypothetical protein
MKPATHHLAQVNIAQGKSTLDDPIMKGFVDQQDEINKLADKSPGFVWRLQTEDGRASGYLRLFEDQRTLLNMSVWVSAEALMNYVYRSHHKDVFRDRNKWFVPTEEASFALWWMAAGQIPTVEEGLRRLQLLRERGPTAEAFTFRQQFPPP